MSKRQEFKDKFYKVYLMKAGVYVGTDGEVPSVDGMVKSLHDWAKTVGIEVINPEHVGIKPSDREDVVSCAFVSNLVIDTPYEEVSPNTFKFSSKHFNREGSITTSTEPVTSKRWLTKDEAILEDTWHGGEGKV